MNTLFFLVNTSMDDNLFEAKLKIKKLTFY